MSVRRLLGTALAMALVGVVLAWVGPDAIALREALAHPQRVADATGPDTVVLAWTAALAWAVWAWGGTGLVLTAATTIPGLLGDAARTLLRGVLPAGARRAAAAALGIGLGFGLTTPALATTTEPVVATAPDWPAAEGAPDWPSAAADRAADPAPDRPAPTGSGHVVVQGECLWDIAATRLASETGRPPADGQIADAVRAWWTANRPVIGPDPDLLLPGQVLQPPGHD